MTRHIVREVQELQSFEVGMANLFIQHTSASLTINENASPDVPLDLNVSTTYATLEGRALMPHRVLVHNLDIRSGHAGTVRLRVG